MIIDHDNAAYQAAWQQKGADRWNGAFYYSKEIVKNIIPEIDTDRNWITVNQPGCGADHSVVFIHNNLNAQRYEWLSRYEDLILVCGVPSTCEKVAHLGKAIYLPLSVDVEYVKRYRREKTKDVAFVGRKSKRRGAKFPPGTEMLYGKPRDIILWQMSEFRRVFSVGRTAIEARILGCEVLPYDKRFPDPEIWKIVDNKEAAKMLQKMLDEIDGRGSVHE